MKKKPKAKSAGRKAAAKKAPAKKPSTTYTPKPLQGNGWAPFRYPPQ
jgi:hypothetical protein